jgi:hypothetical protein
LLRNGGGGGGKATTLFKEPTDKQSEAGHTRQRANSAAREDLTALKAVWSCSHPDVPDHAEQWEAEGKKQTILGRIAIDFKPLSF